MFQVIHKVLSEWLKKSIKTGEQMQKALQFAVDASGKTWSLLAVQNT